MCDAQDMATACTTDAGDHSTEADTYLQMAIVYRKLAEIKDGVVMSAHINEWIDNVYGHSIVCVRMASKLYGTWQFVKFDTWWILARPYSLREAEIFYYQFKNAQACGHILSNKCIWEHSGVRFNYSVHSGHI